jgi:hypothetical protein
MLRIFRGERHVEGAAQGATPPPPNAGNGHSEIGARDLGPAGSAAAQESPAPTQEQPQTDAAPSAEQPTGPETAEQEPGFLDRGRMRRRARFLRAARELAYRDLGGLVFDLHRFGGRNDEVVSAKLETLSRIDSELRILEAALHERMPVTVLREAGVAACPRCAAIHGSGDRFCPACGLAVDQAERPIAGPNAPTPPSAPPPSTAWQPPSTAWQAPNPAWQPPASAAPPPIPGSPPPVPVPARPPIPSASPPPVPDPSPAPEPPAPSAAENPSPPSAPSTGGETPEPQTEVIRSDASGRPPQQRTIAFDPISPRQPKTDPDRAPESERGQERP